MNKTEVIIVGGGIAGLCLASNLARADIAVVVIDQADLSSPKARQSGRTVALLRPSIDVLHRAGIDPLALPDTTPLEQLELIDLPPCGDPLRTLFTATEINHPYFGLNIVNDALHAALINVCRAQKNIMLISPAQVQSLSHRLWRFPRPISGGSRWQKFAAA
jgi:2-polyprenyl-6-methoxyphenol hydroxylase-like FAD-dependent oxidoreductase